MSPVNEATVIEFSYSAVPECIFTQLSGAHDADAPLGQPRHDDWLPYAAAMPDSARDDVASFAHTGVLMLVTRPGAPQARLIHPMRPVRQPSQNARRSPREAAGKGPVLATHPAHLVAVSARRPRPARLVTTRPAADAIRAARLALYPPVSAEPAPGHMLRTTAQIMAITGVFMSLTQSAVGQKMLALF